MGCFPFANSRFQMGVTVMGFAEDFGHCSLGPKVPYCAFGKTDSAFLFRCSSKNLSLVRLSKIRAE